MSLRLNILDDLVDVVVVVVVVVEVTPIPLRSTPNMLARSSRFMLELVDMNGDMVVLTPNPL